MDCVVANVEDEVEHASLHCSRHRFETGRRGLHRDSTHPRPRPVDDYAADVLRRWVRLLQGHIDDL